MGIGRWESSAYQVYLRKYTKEQYEDTQYVWREFHEPKLPHPEKTEAENRWEKKEDNLGLVKVRGKEGGEIESSKLKKRKRRSNV